jgi:hypothetical protein
VPLAPSSIHNFPILKTSPTLRNLFFQYP